MTLRDRDTVLMGNNEDWKEPGVIWFVPGKRGRYGRVNVGFRDDFAQGGMNEKGLSFDAAALQRVPWSEDPKKKTPRNLLEKIMNECATVAEAVEYFETYNSRHLAAAQFLFADATGDSAIIAWDAETGLVVDRIEGAHQVITNTRLKNTEYRCHRFTRAERVLESRSEVSVAAVAAALEAVRQWGEAFTSYSTVYDLKAKTVHVFNLGHFGESVVFDLKAELAKQPATYELKDLFRHSPDLAEIRAKPQRQDFGTRVSLSDKVLNRYAGVYSPEDAPDVRIIVRRDGEGLRVETPGQPDARLFPESEVSFRLIPDRGQVTFHVAPDGSVEGLTLHKQRDMKAKRLGDLSQPAKRSD